MGVKDDAMCQQNQIEFPRSPDTISISPKHVSFILGPLPLRRRILNKTTLERLAFTFAAAVWLSISPAYAQPSPGVRLQAGMAKEDVDGDLKSAMDIYQKIADDRSAARDVRSKALLRLAGCYEKLGQQARKFYEQLVRDFADQPAAAQARTRLAEIDKASRAPVPAAMTQRRIETAGRRLRTSDTDGRQVVYRDDASGELIYGDLGGNHKRVIFNAKPDDLPDWFPSKDMSMVALHFPRKPGRPRFYAVVKTDGTGYREVAHDNPQGDRFVDLDFVNWSWDGRYWLLAGMGGVSVVSVDKGEVRQVVRPSGFHIGNAAFSPDGCWIAYRDSTYKPETGFENVKERILVVPSGGGESRMVYEQPSMNGPWPRLADWTSDNRYIAAIISPGRRISLQLIPVSEGQPGGTPILLRYTTVGQGFATPGGGLVYEAVKPGGLWAAHTASLENGHVGAWQRVTLSDGSVLGSRPVWSPDGSRLMYLATNEDQSGDDTVNLLDLSSGQDRVVSRSGVDCRSWEGRGSRLLCTQPRGKGKFDAVWLSPDSGEIEPIHTFANPYLRVARPSRDGRALFLYKPGTTALVQDVVRWDIATGQATLAYSYQSPKEESMGTRLSPDEHWLIRNSGQGIEICPLGGSHWKTVATLDPSTSSHYYGAALTPDGSWLFYLNRDAAGKLAIFRVATAGGDAQYVGDFPSKSSEYAALDISPDGGKILAHTWENADGWEMWSLENFLPIGSDPHAKAVKK